MHDPRIDSLARQLVRYSTKVTKGDRVMIDIYDAPNSIALALIREVVAAKAIPVVKIHDAVVTRELMKHADPEGYDLQCENSLALMKEMDAYIAVRGSHNITEMSDVPADKMKTLDGKYYTYTLDMLMERGLNKISLGVVDKLSNITSFS